MDNASFQMCTHSYFTISAFNYSTDFYLYYFTHFSKLEKPPNTKTNKKPPKSNQQTYAIQKHYQKNYKSLFHL